MGMATNLLIVLCSISAVAWLYGIGVTGTTEVCPADATFTPDAPCNPYTPMILAFFNPAEYGSSGSAYNASISINESTFTDQAFSFISEYFGLFLVAGVGIVGIMTALGFPNPYIIFAPAALVLFNLAVLPMRVLDQVIVYEPLRIVVVAVLNILFIIAVMSWWKGSDTP